MIEKKNTLLISVLAVLILAAISFLLGLQIAHVYPLTGFATNNETGLVNITILPTISIHLLNDSIDFGACEINTTRGYALINSEQDGSSGHNVDCYGDFPSALLIENDGTWYVNTTVQVTESPDEFFGENSSWLAYRTHNVTGCSGTQDAWLNLTNETSFRACDLLSVGARFNLTLLAHIPVNASGGGILSFLFAASQVP